MSYVPSDASLLWLSEFMAELDELLGNRCGKVGLGAEGVAAEPVGALLLLVAETEVADFSRRMQALCKPLSRHISRPSRQPSQSSVRMKAAMHRCRGVTPASREVRY